MLDNQKLLEVIKLQTEIAKLGLDLSEVMHLVVERCLLLTQADGAAIEFREGDEMVYRAAAGNAEKYLGLRLNIHHSLSGLSVLDNESKHCPDTEIDPRVDREATRKIGLRSMLVIPLSHNDATIGILKVMSQVY